MNLKAIIIWITLLAAAVSANAFCGFYVARADAKLFNHQSQVILVRDGNRTVITMSNDFQGDVKDFAMVVPVPVVLQEDDIRVTNRLLFDRLDAYSGPRVVEYYDENPCYRHRYLEKMATSNVARTAVEDMAEAEQSAADLGVSIEAKYTIGEYDILILSAKESTGLKTWLTTNGYKIPESAEEVLDPYIKNDLKFFVVKVNLEEMQSRGFDYLSPIQITFESDRFMLPIRLGMANAENAQDLIVYALTRKGRVESANYRTAKMPTDREVPLFVQNDFGKFYKDLFDRAYRRENRNAVFLEYAWDVSPRTSMKCDPCVSVPPEMADFQEAGANWIQDFSSSSDVFFTRLHVRYTRDKFPQDLLFQVTPNKERFQARYVTRHPAQGDLSCQAGQEYLYDLVNRRKREVQELAYLTGWRGDGYYDYIYEKSNLEELDDYREKRNEGPLGIFARVIFKNTFWKWMAAMSALFSLLAVGWLVSKSLRRIQ